MKSNRLNLFKIVLVLLLINSCSGLNISPHNKLKWLDGTWNGTGYQIDLQEDNTWAISLKIDATAGVFSINYPSIPCNGIWELISLSKEQARFKETITQGTQECVPEGHILLSKVDDRTVILSFFYPGEPIAYAFSTLRKE